MILPIEKAQIAKTTEQWTSLNPVLDLDVIGNFKSRGSETA